MENSSKIQEAADRIWEQLESGNTCPPIRDLIDQGDQQSAYAIQDVNTQRRLDRGERVVGIKVGLTSFSVQSQLGVDQPDFGVLTDAMRIAYGQSVPWEELNQPKAEMEIAFVLSKDIQGEELTMDQLKASISAAVPALEIVGSRIEGWNIRIADTIADNASASHFVLGEPVSYWEDLDLVECKMSMLKNGELVSEGTGKACMDHPLNAALWLVNTMVRLGRPLKAGYVVLAGALGPMTNIQPGDQITGSIEGFSTVDVSFGSPKN